ncbi:MAG: hypothetical protein H7Y36_05720 [Armatimonadetes bacterium]|nr:hypothetical protein [Akkermansiaceae bacterium]
MICDSRYALREVTRNEPIIEAEVVEIDGIAVEQQLPFPQTQSQRRADWTDWRGWQRRVSLLDARWMPLWLIIGFVALILIIAFGMCMAVVVICYKIIVGIVRAFISLFIPSSSVQVR